LFAADDQRRLRDQRQALLDPVGERRPCGRQESNDAEADVVVGRACEQRPRFPRCITQSVE
jgi:hypothetical protein